MIIILILHILLMYQRFDFAAFVTDTVPEMSNEPLGPDPGALLGPQAAAARAANVGIQRGGRTSRSSLAPLLPDDPRLQVVAGDVTAPEKLAPVLEGAAVVFNASSGRSYEQVDP